MLKNLGSQSYGLFSTYQQSLSSATGETISSGTPLSNALKYGSWAAGCYRAGFLIFAIAKLGCKLKSVCWDKEDARWNGPYANNKYVDLSVATIVVAENALSLCAWADRMKLISLGRASSRVQLTSFAFEMLINYYLAFRVNEGARVLKRVFVYSNSAEKKILKHERSLCYLSSVHFLLRAWHGIGGAAATWKGEKWPVLNVVRQVAEISVTLTGAASFGYGFFIEKQRHAYRKDHDYERI